MRQGQQFKWTEKQDKAFNEINGKFKYAKGLNLMRKGCNYGIETDAWKEAPGARMYQINPDNEKKVTVSYASRSVKDAEKKYMTTELEGLAKKSVLQK